MAKKRGNPNLKKGMKSFNPNGRPPGSGNKSLRLALEAYEKENDKSFIEHYIDQAFNDRKTACDLAGRLYPALKSIEGNLGIKHKILTAIGLEPIGDDVDRSG